MTNPYIHFTPLQADFIQHRLALEHNIAEVFADTPGLDHFQSTSVVACALSMEKELMGGLPNRIYIYPETRKLQSCILVECLEGSTWLGNVDNLTPQKGAWMRKAMREAAFKIALAFDLDIRDITLPEG